VINLLKLSSCNAWRGNQLAFRISVVTFLVLIFTNILVQSNNIYGQSDPFNSANSCSKLSVSGITASGADALNPPSHAIDQNINTRWSNLGLGSWIQLDLGKENVICSIGINWHRGNERINSFVIAISKDGKSFTNVFSGKSDGTSLTEQNYNTQLKTGRFVKVTVTANTQSNWISISELKVYGYKPISESCVNSQISQVTAASSQIAFPPSNLVDNNLNTIWSNYGIGSSIQIDLGTSKRICNLDIAWYKGNERQNNFVISTSQDGKSFKNVLSSASSGKSTAYEKYVFSDNLARYIKITVNGNTQNNYASIAEIRAQAPASSQPQVECVDGHIQNAKTSGSQTGFPGTKVLDDNLDTRWSNNGVGSWVQIDLGTSNKICDINIAWYKGNERQNNFVISTSTDGIKFSNVFSSKSSGSTLGLEKYNIADTIARFVRITVNGNTQNSYASITEISVKIFPISGSSNYYIGAAGDWGSARNNNWEETVDLMINSKINLALGLGDYSYGSLSDFEPVLDTLKAADIPFKGVLGNHDSSSYASLFGQPSMLYAFDAGQARIILLNTEDSDSANTQFLENELKNTKQPWKIVAMHNPLYTSPSIHPEEKELAAKLQPLIDKYGVQLVLYGHNHNYERIKLPDKPTLYVQAGTAGESHYDIKGSRSGGGVEFQDDNDYGFVKLTINSNKLSGQFISHDGKVLDSFSLLK
jgi:predicted phosphodiesterase